MSSADGAAPIPRSPYRADRFAFGESEYDWALHNNLRLNDTAAAAVHQSSWPVVERSARRS